VLVIIDEKDAAPLRSPHLDFAVDSYGPWPEGLSLRREDLYGENGRCLPLGAADQPA
jgi:hypothetical protein